MYLPRISRCQYRTSSKTKCTVDNLWNVVLRSIFKFVDEDVIKMDRNDTSLYKYTFAPNIKHQTLGVIGLVQAIGSTFPIAEMQCRWVTKVFKGKLTLFNLFHGIMNLDYRHNVMRNNIQKTNYNHNCFEQFNYSTEKSI